MKTVKIKSIKKLKEKNDRYDLTVPKNSNFFANGILIHNTSGRTGRLLEVKKRNWLHKLLGLYKRKEYKYISGTRRVVIDPKKATAGYHDGQFRGMVHRRIQDAGLREGETLYYEIVGYEDTGRLIMPAHTISDKKLFKKYGSRMTYKYGCEEGKFKVLVYRITITTDSGHVIELPWAQIETRCKELGFDAVPILSGPFILQNKEDLFDICERLSQGNSTLDHEHIREGVVVRIEHPNKIACFKYKSFWFAELEGIIKNDDTYVDPEEIA